jgi:hypothetical protein
MPKRRIVEVRYVDGRVRYPHSWTVVERGSRAVIDTARTRAEAVEIGRTACRDSWAYYGMPAQMVVYTKRGRISFERTYGLDPRRRKG